MNNILKCVDDEKNSPKTKEKNNTLHQLIIFAFLTLMSSIHAIQQNLPYNESMATVSAQAIQIIPNDSFENSGAFYDNDFRRVGIPQSEHTRLVRTTVSAINDLSHDDVFEADMERLNEFYIINDCWTRYWGILGATCGFLRNISTTTAGLCTSLLGIQTVTSFINVKAFSEVMVVVGTVSGVAAICFDGVAKYFFRRRDRRKKINMRARKVRAEAMENGLANANADALAISSGNSPLLESSSSEQDQDTYSE